MDGRFDKLDERVGLLEESSSRIERKLDNVTDHQAEKLDDHEKRITRVEDALVS